VTAWHRVAGLPRDLPLPWNCVWQRPQQFLSRFARTPVANRGRSPGGRRGLLGRDLRPQARADRWSVLDVTALRAPFPIDDLIVGAGFAGSVVAERPASDDRAILIPHTRVESNPYGLRWFWQPPLITRQSRSRMGVTTVP
jgi:hypothetical protein